MALLALLPVVVSLLKGPQDPVLRGNCSSLLDLDDFFGHCFFSCCFMFECFCAFEFCLCYYCFVYFVRYGSICVVFVFIVFS